MTDTTETTEQDGPGVSVQTPDQPASATVDTDQTSQEELIGGKFKSQEDLLAAYKELEQKLGAGDSQQQQQDDTSSDDGTDQDTTESREGGDVEGEYVYSEQMDSVLKEAEIDPSDLAKRFETDGELSEDDYAKLEKAGYPKAMVDAYVNGLKSSQQQAEAITEAQIEQIKQSVGGEETFGKVQQHIANSYTQEQIEAYNAAVESGDAVKAQAAVQEALQSYQREIGFEGKMVGGKSPAGEVGYTSEAEMLEDMQKPEYKNSQAFRDKVAKKLAASPNLYQTR